MKRLTGGTQQAEERRRQKQERQDEYHRHAGHGCHFPTTQISGAPSKPILQPLLERRATLHFEPDPVPDDYMEAILRLMAQAPSGYNLRPRRFIVVRKPGNRARLQKAARDQSKVGEAPVVIIAYGGRFAVEDTIHQEHYGREWAGEHI